MAEFFRRLWCALRDHPYPLDSDDPAYQDWLAGIAAVPPRPRCSNCGAALKGWRYGGMRS